MNAFRIQIDVFKDTLFPTGMYLLHKTINYKAGILVSAPSQNAVF